MTRLIHIAAFVAAFVVGATSCSDDDKCDVDFGGIGDSKYDENKCDAVGLIVDCVFGTYADISGLTDDQLREVVDFCADDIVICSDDVGLIGLMPGLSFRELRGESNECIG